MDVEKPDMNVRLVVGENVAGEKKDISSIVQ